MRRPSLVRTATVAATAAILAAACGTGSSNTSSKSPQAAFRAGLSGLGDTSALTVTLKLDTTPDALVGFAKESGDTLSAASAAGLAGASIVVEIRTTNGKNLSAIKPGSSVGTATRIAVIDNGTTYAEIVSLDGTLYVHADLKDLVALLGQSKAYAELKARAATLPPFVKAFVAGDWVSLDLDKLAGMVGQFGITMPTAEQSAALIKAIESVLATDITMTRVGSDTDGDHLKLSAHSSKLVTDLLQAVATNVPPLGALLGKVATKAVADHSIIVDAWVKNGSLAKVSLDAVQFAKPGEAKPTDHLPIVLTFDKSGAAIDKPSSVTPVDLTQLLTLLGGLTGLGG